MGRATSGVTGMKFRDGDQLLSLSVIRAAQVAAEEAAEHGDLPDVQEQYVFTITDGGFAKRTRISEYRLQSRGGLGIKAMKQDDDRGTIVGAFIVVEGDEVLAIKQSGQVTRSAVDEHLRPTGRDTKGVRFVGVSPSDGVAVVARSVERAPEIEEAVEEAVDAVDAVEEATEVNPNATDATIEGAGPGDDIVAGAGDDPDVDDSGSDDAGSDESDVPDDEES
jgi:DNA gyrase subunit A